MLQTIFNQPAGHLENGEALTYAVTRETREETGYDFNAEAISGIYRWIEPKSCDTYLRVCFTGMVKEERISQSLDEGIVNYHWLELDEIKQLNHRLRSPLVMRCIEDYLTGNRYPLTMLVDLNE